MRRLLELAEVPAYVLALGLLGLIAMRLTAGLT